MTRKNPIELNQIMQFLGDEWKLISVGFWNMGWFADLQIKERKFQLVSDRGYIDVYEKIEEKLLPILPPFEQRLSITPAQVSALLKNA
ncbi:MAG: hypothetical protein HY867_02105 [Chloroflexi bacterium]|nr:hypothetical protein [Chloroflexota bacterium]